MSTVDEIYKQVEDLISREDFDKLVKEKIIEMQGKCDEGLAASLVVHHMNVQNPKIYKQCPFRKDICLEDNCQLWNDYHKNCAFKLL